MNETTQSGDPYFPDEQAEIQLLTILSDETSDSLLNAIKRAHDADVTKPLGDPVTDEEDITGMSLRRGKDLEDHDPEFIIENVDLVEGELSPSFRVVGPIENPRQIKLFVGVGYNGAEDEFNNPFFEEDKDKSYNVSLDYFPRDNSRRTARISVFDTSDMGADPEHPSPKRLSEMTISFGEGGLEIDAVSANPISNRELVRLLGTTLEVIARFESGNQEDSTGLQFRRY